MFGSRKDDQMLDQIFNLKFLGKQMSRQAGKVWLASGKDGFELLYSHQEPLQVFPAHVGYRWFRAHACRLDLQCEKDMKSARTKIKKAIEKGNIEGARIFSQVARSLPLLRVTPCRRPTPA